MNNRLDYKDTDKKIEIGVYGLKFEISSNVEEIDIEELENKKNVNIEEFIDKVLGAGASEKINAKRIEDGYSTMDSHTGLIILSFAVNTYVNASIAPVSDVINNYNNKVNRVNNFKNREQRRKYRYRRY